MYSKKEITERFEVTRTTLHNWKTSKPNLYNLLLHSDSSNNELREITIILEKYSKTIKSQFEIEEVEFILDLDLENYLEEILKINGHINKKGIGLALNIKDNFIFIPITSQIKYD